MTAGKLVTVTETTQPPATPASRPLRSPAVRRALIVVLVLNVIVTAAKLAIGLHTRSLAVLGAALESGLDVLNNVIGMILVSVSALEPDEGHPYGHDKFETIGALGIVIFLSISCFELLRGGVTSLVHGTPPHAANATQIGLLAATGIVNLFVVWFERARGRLLASAFLMADSEHTRSDIYVTVLALASLALTRAGLGWLDAVLAIVVALLIGWSGYQILKMSIPILVDARAVEPEALRRLVCEVPDVVTVRSIRSRYTTSGLLFAELTIAVPGGTTVAAAHAIADEVEARIADRFGAAEVTVHVEPA